MSAAHRDLPGRVLLRRLLTDRNKHPERAEEIDAEIRSHFERELTVLVMDMVGFSRISQKLGIIAFLAMIAEMYSAARPAVLANGGRVIKLEADNLYAVYNSPVEALESALDIFRAFGAINSVVPDDRDIFGCIGIGHGPILVIDEEDFFGCEVNLASKLGEDLAGSSEILLTKAAFDSLTSKSNRYQFDTRHTIAGGVPLEYYSFRARLDVEGNELEENVSHGQAGG